MWHTKLMGTVMFMLVGTLLWIKGEAWHWSILQRAWLSGPVLLCAAMLFIQACLEMRKEIMEKASEEASQESSLTSHGATPAKTSS
ncbi:MULTISPECIES: hypothetical protein [Achromobacter]|uniref:hypothetical protein n=1 Tax=Achromobacter TaxID=222 RepID=UPI0023F91DFB|nr:hypothetical protein [Achromobacter anxifer]MDF8365099.1 hypothetical protein [Achromobacter anxifer]